MCDDVHAKCVLPDQLVTCAGIADGTACEISGRPMGVCKDAVCLLAGCGDGSITGSEECDTTVPADRDDCLENDFYAGGAVGCTADCTLDRSGCTGRCGDGVLNGNEACDDAGTSVGTDDQLAGKTCLSFGFYSDLGLACSAACTFDVTACTGYCGDGVVNGSEVCDGTQLGGVDSCNDLGFYDTDPVSCTTSCTFDTSSCDDFCGDGITNGAEACDPGATSAGSDDDLAGKTCTSFAFYQAGGLACSGACTFVTSACSQTCGDGTRNGPEACDNNRTTAPGDDDLAGADCTRLGFYFPANLKCSAACGFDDSACTGYCGDRNPDAGFELCEGRAPAGETCLQYGFESGPLDCLGSCGLDFRGCHRPRWSGTTLGTNTYHDAWSSRPGDVFVVGQAGSIVRFDGTSWTAMTSGTTVELMSIWGFASNEVFAVGFAGTILHYDGATWSAMSSGTTQPLLGVWGTAANNVYAVGAEGTLLHYDGLNWSPLVANVGTSWLYAVWGSGPNDVYVVVDDRTLRHFTGGATWSTVTLPPISDLRSIAGTGPNDIYAVGDTGTVVHWDGATWTVLNINTQSSLYDVWAAGPRDVYVGAVSSQVVHFDGGSWTTLDTGGQQAIDGLWGTSAAEVFAVGTNGMIRRLDGEAWHAQPTQAQATLNDVWGDSPTNAYAVGLGNIVHYDGNTWTVQLVQGGGAPNLLGVWGASPSAVFAVGLGGVMVAFDGSAWSPVTSNTSASLFAVWGTSASNVIAVGASGANQVYNGSTWAPGPSTNVSATLRGVWGSSATDVFAVGDGGTIVHRTTGAWSPMTSTTGNTLYGVWGSSATDVYVVGDAGTLLHFNGTAWTAITGVTSVDLRGVTGTGPADVFVAGTTGAVYHFDGLLWSVMQSATSLTLRHVSIAGGDVIAVGEGVITQRARACLATESVCGDGVDNDCDGRFDCSDTDCAGVGNCSTGGVCAGAASIQCGDIVSIQPGGAVTDVIDRYACTPLAETGPERMFQVVAPSTTAITATLSNLTSDLDLIVLGAGPGGGCDRRQPGCLGASSTSGATEAVTFAAQSGGTYYIVVDAYSASTGGFTLQLTCP